MNITSLGRVTRVANYQQPARPALREIFPVATFLLWSFVICHYAYLGLSPFGKHNPFFFGVEVSVRFAVDFAAGHRLGFWVAEAGVDFLRWVSARWVKSQLDSAISRVRLPFSRHWAKVCSGVFDAAGLAISEPIAWDGGAEP